MLQWRFLNTGSADASRNMALDEALLQLHDAGVTPPTLRVYAWETPTLSLGYAQNAAQDVELEGCRQYGVAIVRRPTGGRAVLHDQEVTYSVVLPTTFFPGPDTLMAHYRHLGMALQATLQRLGVPVHLERSRLPTHTPHPAAAPACFTAVARYELSVMGRKITGNAQKRLRHALLQHGAMPLWLDRQRLFACLRMPLEHRQALVQEAYHTMTAINEMTINPVNASAVHRALRDGFMGTFGIELIEAPLLPQEERLAQELQATKYAVPLWNLGGPSAWRAATAGPQ
jgi:lipoate-protein ligase A